MLFPMFLRDDIIICLGLLPLEAKCYMIIFADLMFSLLLLSLLCNYWQVTSGEAGIGVFSKYPLYVPNIMHFVIVMQIYSTVPVIQYYIPAIM